MMVPPSLFRTGSIRGNIPNVLLSAIGICVCVEGIYEYPIRDPESYSPINPFIYLT